MYVFPMAVRPAATHPSPVGCPRTSPRPPPAAAGSLREPAVAAAQRGLHRFACIDSTSRMSSISTSQANARFVPRDRRLRARTRSACCMLCASALHCRLRAAWCASPGFRFLCCTLLPSWGMPSLTPRSRLSCASHLGSSRLPMPSTCTTPDAVPLLGAPCSLLL